MLSRRSFFKISTIAGGALLSQKAFSEVVESFAATSLRLSSDSDSEAYWDIVKEHFSIRPGLQYFNNGSLGPSPEMVQDATDKFRRTLDSFPSYYMFAQWRDEKETVREKAADLFNVSHEEIALIHNTTEGMNVIAFSMDLEPGDEVILLDHEHPSGTIPWIHWQESKGIKLVRPKMPILPKTPDEVIDVYRQAITPRTKVISMCHMVNTNGMILPVKEVSAMAHERGILVAVDGAQTSGMLDIDLHDLDCDFYATSTHKWTFSPKGTGLLYAKKDKQDLLKPLIVCNGFDDTSIRRLENYNTRNLPEVLGLGAAIDFHNMIGTKKKAARIIELKKHLRNSVAGNKSFRVKTPFNDKLSAGITNIEVVGHDVRKVEKVLTERYKINCRPMWTYDLNGLRISTSIFNTKSDIDYLVNALKEIAAG